MGVLVLTQHFPVVTFGKHAKEANLLLPEDFLKEKGIDVFHIERGGDITFHGPGQLVVYPILDLQRLGATTKNGIGVKRYVNILEEAVIQTLNLFGIKADRLEGAPGVWVKTSNGPEKICALGIKCTRFCTMHGLALNVSTDLDYFKLINPCGFTDKGVTSMEKILKRPCDFEEVKNVFSHIFLRLIFSL